MNGDKIVTDTTPTGREYPRCMNDPYDSFKGGVSDADEWAVSDPDPRWNISRCSRGHQHSTPDNAYACDVLPEATRRPGQAAVDARLREVEREVAENPGPIVRDPVDPGAEDIYTRRRHGRVTE
jgi:hypothetical protein